MTLLHSHEALCHLNPDKHLKDVYRGSSGGDGFPQLSSGDSELDASTITHSPFGENKICRDGPLIILS